jgi:Protein phosphatase 2C
MHVRTQTRWLPKAGNTLDEYEDAVCPQECVDRRLFSFRCAIADGATEASFSGLWARLLVEGWYSRRLGSRRLTAALSPLQQAWSRHVSARPLPWYAEEKLRSGAFAAFLGLSMQHDPRSGYKGWSALAVGDSCVFQLRGGRILAAFPLTHWTQFDNRPALLSSVPTYNARLGPYIRRASGTWCSGDTFLLMTDAIASWFLRESSTSPVSCPMIEFPSVDTDGITFAGWIDELRRQDHLRNDDVTVLTVNVF